MFAFWWTGASGGGRVLSPPWFPPPASQSGLTRTEGRFKGPRRELVRISLSDYLR